MDRGDSARDRLIDIASRVFAAGGYHGTSYNDLISQSGLSKGAFYHHFSSKEQLALAVVRAKQQQVIRHWSNSAAWPERMPERLFAKLRERAKLFAADRTLQCLPRLCADFARDPALAKHVVDLHSPAIDAIEAMLLEGQGEGTVRAVDARASARAIFAALVGIDEVSERESRGSDQVERTEEFICLLEAALRPAQVPRNGRRTPERTKASPKHRRKP